MRRFAMTILFRKHWGTDSARLWRRRTARTSISPHLGFGKTMKRLALRLMQNCGVFALTRVMSAQMARILMYHNFSGPNETGTDAVNSTALRRQLAYLQSHFHVVPLTCIFERLKAGRPLDKLTVALTIDDGRRNFYEFM